MEEIKVVERGTQKNKNFYNPTWDLGIPLLSKIISVFVYYHKPPKNRG